MPEARLRLLVLLLMAKSSAKLKVYYGSLDGRYSFCVAAYSLASVARIARGEGFNTSISTLRDYWTITGNDEQIAAAIERPGLLMRTTEKQGSEYRPYRDQVDPPSRKFGYTHAVEMREIEAQLEADGVPEIERYLRAVAIYQERHKNDLSLRQRQELARQDRLANPPPRGNLNAEEIAYLVERLEGVNDEVGQSARAVLTRMMR